MPRYNLRGRSYSAVDAIRRLMTLMYSPLRSVGMGLSQKFNYVVTFDSLTATLQDLLLMSVAIVDAIAASSTYSVAGIAFPTLGKSLHRNQVSFRP